MAGMVINPKPHQTSLPKLIERAVLYLKNQSIAISPRRIKGPHIVKPPTVSRDHYLIPKYEKGSTSKQQ